MSSSKNIRLMRSSVIYGPFSADQLRHMASTQIITSTDLVSVDNGPWKPIKLSVNEEQQKPVSQIEKPKEPAEAPSEPIAPINAVKLPLLFEKISNSIVKTLNSFSNKSLKPITAIQSATPNIPIDPDNANNPSIPTTAKNNFATALGCGAIILPCLFCGFLGTFLPKSDPHTNKNDDVKSTSYKAEETKTSLAISRNMAKSNLIETFKQFEDPQVAIRIVETIGLTEIKELPISAMDDTIYRNNFSPETRAAYQVWRSSIIKAPLSYR